MVFSGFTFQRLFAAAVCAIFSLIAVNVVRAQSTDVAGTMPEDYLPELKTILATALARSPSVMVPLFEIEMRRAGKIREDSARLPSLGSNFSYGRTELSESGNSTSRSRDQGLQYNIGLNQPLYYWGALANQSAIARINVLLAEKNHAKAFRELSVLLRKMYLDLIVRKARLRQERETLRLAREYVAVLKARLDRGLATPADVSGEELRIRELTLAFDRLEAEVTGVRKTFSRLAGIPELTEAAIPAELPAPVYSEALTTAISAALLRDGAKSTLEAKIYELREQEAQRRYEIEKVRLLPKFKAGAGYSLENTTTVGTSVGQRAVARQTLSISANWDIFDGFATKGAKMEAKAVQRLQKARGQAELDELLETAQALERQLKLDVTKLEFTEIRRSLAVQARKRAGEEVEFGNLPKSAIDRADNGILLAQVNSFAARAEFFSRWSEFVAIAGADPVMNTLSVSHDREKK